MPSRKVHHDRQIVTGVATGMRFGKTIDGHRHLDQKDKCHACGHLEQVLLSVYKDRGMSSCFRSRRPSSAFTPTTTTTHIHSELFASVTLYLPIFQPTYRKYAVLRRRLPRLRRPLHRRPPGLPRRPSFRGGYGQTLLCRQRCRPFHCGRQN